MSRDTVPTSRKFNIRLGSPTKTLRGTPYRWWTHTSAFTELTTTQPFQHRSANRDHRHPSSPLQQHHSKPAARRFCPDWPHYLYTLHMLCWRPHSKPCGYSIQCYVGCEKEYTTRTACHSMANMVQIQRDVSLLWWRTGEPTTPSSTPEEDRGVDPQRQSQQTMAIMKETLLHLTPQATYPDAVTTQNACAATKTQIDPLATALFHGQTCFRPTTKLLESQSMSM